MLQVSQILNSKGIKHRLIEMDQEAFTVDDVLKYSHGEINGDETCKTIIVQGRKGTNMYAILVRGRDRLDFSKVMNEVGEAVEIADHENVIKAAGCEPGAVCPFLLNVALIVDKRVLELKKINCGSRHHLFGLEFDSADLKKVVDYRIGDFIR